MKRKKRRRIKKGRGKAAAKTKMKFRAAAAVWAFCLRRHRDIISKPRRRRPKKSNNKHSDHTITFDHLADIC